MWKCVECGDFYDKRDEGCMDGFCRWCAPYTTTTDEEEVDSCE